MQNVELSPALAATWEIVARANHYLVEKEPWKIKDDAETRDELGSILYASAETLRILAVLIYPIMPRAASVLWSQLGIEEPLDEQRLPEAAEWGKTRSRNSDHERRKPLPPVGDGVGSSGGEGRPGAGDSEERSREAASTGIGAPRDDPDRPSSPSTAPVGGETSRTRVSREAPPIHPKVRLGIVAAR